MGYELFYNSKSDFLSCFILQMKKLFWVTLTGMLCVLFSACGQEFSSQPRQQVQTGLVAMVSDLYTGSYSWMELSKVRELQYEELKKREQEYIRSLPNCNYAKSNREDKPQKLDLLLVNCKKVKKEGHLVSGIGGMRDINAMVNGTYSVWGDEFFYRSLLCKERNDYYAIGEDGDYYPIEQEIDAQRMIHKWGNPLKARIKNQLWGKKIIDKINLYNDEVGAIWMYGGAPFRKIAPMGYGENEWHYYLIGRKTYPVTRDDAISDAVYVIDGVTYDVGERSYLDDREETIKQSERVLEGLSGDAAIFKRMTNGRFKKGIWDPFDYEIKHGNAMVYDLKTCELPLQKNPNFVSSLGENKINPELTHRYQQEQNTFETQPLRCEGSGYFDQLKNTNEIYYLHYDPQTATYRKYIPELCATISTSPLNLWGIWNHLDEATDWIKLERKGNQIYNPKFYDKKPVLIFENKDRNQNLDFVVQKDAKKADPNCQLIEYENIHYQIWSPLQAKPYAFIAPFFREGWRDKLYCLNKYEEEDSSTEYPRPRFDYYVLADVKYPGMYVYAIDQAGNKYIENNLTLFFGQK